MNTYYTSNYLLYFAIILFGFCVDFHFLYYNFGLGKHLFFPESQRRAESLWSQRRALSVVHSAINKSPCR